MQEYILETKVSVVCKFFNSKPHSENPISCKWCNKSIFFDDKFKSHLDILIPIDADTKQIHECENREWSVSVPCRSCMQLLKFNNSVRGKNGNKIPHNLNYCRHRCTAKKINREQEK